MTRESTSAVPAYVGLGADIGGRLAQRRSGVAARGIRPLPASSIARPYIERRRAGIDAQPRFINAVRRVITGIDADALIRALVAVGAHRGPPRAHWASISLVCDSRVYDAVVHASGELVLPHSRLHERAFVLYP